MHRSIVLAIVSFTILLLAAAPFANAQTAKPEEARFGSLDVLVTDGAGQRVTGLTRLDFSVRENGTPVEVTNAASGTLPRRIVMYFDNSSLSTTFRHEFIDAAKAFIPTLRPGDRVMIATWNRAFAVPLTWNADRATISGALDAIASETAAATQRTTEKAQIDSQIAGLLRTDAAAASDESDAAMSMSFDSLMASARRFAESEQLAARQSLAAIDAVLEALAGVDGRKAVIIASEWLPTQPGGDLFQQLDSVKQKVDQGSISTAAMKESSARSSPLTEMSRYSVAEQLANVQKTAQASQVAVYVMSAPAGERGPFGGVSGPAAETETGSATVIDALRSLATSTGGVTWIGTTPADVLISVGADLDARHTIGYRSKAAEGTPVRIDVATNNGMQVRAQKALVVRSAAAVMEQRVLAHHAQPPLTNGLGIVVRHLEITAEGDKRRVPVQVLVPIGGLTLKQDGAAWVGGFSVFTSSGTAAGDSTAVSRQDRELRLDEDQKAKLSAPGQGVVLQFDVIVEPGVDRISIGVLDREFRNAGFYRLELAP